MRRALSFILLFVALVVGVGCGDSKDSSTSASTQASTGDTTSQQGSPVVQEASKMIDAAREPLQFKPPGPSIDASKLKGKTIAILNVDQRSPVLARVAAEEAKAAKTMGIKTTTYDAKAEVNRMLQGMDQAIQNADAIVNLGIPTAVIGGKLKEAKAKKIPVVNVLNNQPDSAAPGQGAGPLYYATSAPDYVKSGQLAAAKAVVDTKGKANALIYSDKQLTPSPPVVKGMQDMLSKCADCSSKSKDIPFGEWATAVTPETQSAIRANPKLNYILPIFDDMAIFVDPAVQQAGASDRVHSASLNGTPAALKLVQKNDGVYTADVGAPIIWLAWHSVDQAFRGMLGDQPGDPTIPLRYLDAENLKGVDVDNLDAPYGDNLGYREGFTKLWGG